jgi:glucosamine--fructose-6-phosphate aminotransferase (isomerizing)
MRQAAGHPNQKQASPIVTDILDKKPKTEFTTFMLKEIFAQPKNIANLLAERVVLKKTQIKFEELKKNEKKLKRLKNITIIACGSSWHAGLVGECLIEQLAKIPVEVEDASEFRYRDPIIEPDSLIIAISQSGETADTVAALKLAKKKRAFTFSIGNVAGSTMAKLADASCTLEAGTEISVAATKSFTAELTILTLLAIYLGRLNKKLAKQETQKILNELIKIPGLIQNLLNKNEEILLLAQKFQTATNFIYLGQGYNFPIALEGALKLKEISYLQAEGYPTGEIKHGPMAMIDEKTSVIFVATQEKTDNQIITNMTEVKADGAKIITLAFKDDKKIAKVADQIIYMPKTLDLLMPILNVIPLQLFAYNIAELKGRNIDRPRNLTKVVGKK